MRNSKVVMKLLAAMLWCVVSVGCVAEEVVSNTKTLSNQGFVKGSEKDGLKNKFPICDDFLNISWINKKQGVGYVKHDLYKEGKLAGQMESLVFMHKENEQMYRPYDRLELYTYRQKGEIDKLFDAIKNGEVTNRVDVVYKDYVVPLRGNNIYDMTYADNTETVCIPYQSLQRAWIVEGKSSKYALSDDEVNTLHESIIINGTKQPKENIYRHFVLDLNGDGKNDLFPSHVQYVFISNKSKYEYLQKLNYISAKNGGYWGFGLKAIPSLCDVFDQSYFFITTDGSNFYLNNQCNFKDMTNKLGG